MNKILLRVRDVNNFLEVIMKSLFLGILLISSSAFASLEEFQGRYEVISGSNGTTACHDFFDVVYDSSLSQLDIISSGSYVQYHIPSINKGSVDFAEDLGDVWVKGKQKNTFDGKNKVVHKVKILGGLKLFRKVLLTFSSDKLTIVRETDGSKKCVLRKM